VDGAFLAGWKGLMDMVAELKDGVVTPCMVFRVLFVVFAE